MRSRRRLLPDLPCPVHSHAARGIASMTGAGGSTIPRSPQNWSVIPSVDDRNPIGWLAGLWLGAARWAMLTHRPSGATTPGACKKPPSVGFPPILASSNSLTDARASLFGFLLARKDGRADPIGPDHRHLVSRLAVDPELGRRDVAHDEVEMLDVVAVRLGDDWRDGSIGDLDHRAALLGCATAGLPAIGCGLPSESSASVLRR